MGVSGETHTGCAGCCIRVGGVGRRVNSTSRVLAKSISVSVGRMKQEPRASSDRGARMPRFCGSSHGGLWVCRGKGKACGVAVRVAC